MSGSTELLVLRLALIAIVFVFAFAAAMSLRATLAPRRTGAVTRTWPRLIIEAPARTGLMRGTEFDLAGDTTVGRDSANGIVLADPSISGRHASIERTARGWLVRDLGSMNGTSVAARAIDGRGAELRPGDELRVGAVRFRFFV